MKVLLFYFALFSILYCISGQPVFSSDDFNHFSIKFNHLSHSNYLINCSNVNDHPAGCSKTLIASNDTQSSRQLCTRTCTHLNNHQVKLLTTLTSPIEVEVSVIGADDINTVTCNMKWHPRMYVTGYDLRIHYIWIDHLFGTRDYIQLIRCEIHGMKSVKPVQEGKTFFESRTLVMDYRVSTLQQIVALSFSFIAIFLASCCCAAFITLLFVTAVGWYRDQRAPQDQWDMKKPLNKKDAVDPSYEQGPVNFDMNDPQPLYVPYFMLSPYSVPELKQEETNEVGAEQINEVDL